MEWKGRVDDNFPSVLLFLLRYSHSVCRTQCSTHVRLLPPSPLPHCGRAWLRDPGGERERATAKKVRESQQQQQSPQQQQQQQPDVIRRRWKGSAFPLASFSFSEYFFFFHFLLGPITQRRKRQKKKKKKKRKKVGVFSFPLQSLVALKQGE